MKNLKHSRTTTYIVLAILIVVGLIIVTVHHKKPDDLASNTPTNISLGGVYSITSPCPAYTSKQSNPGGYDPTEYFASCNTNQPNNPIAADSDTAPGLPPGINYNFYSYSTYKNIDAPQPSICNGNSFTQHINGITFYICEQSAKGSVYQITATALSGVEEAEIWIGGVGASNLPSNALRSLDNTLGSFSFIGSTQ